MRMCWRSWRRGKEGRRWSFLWIFGFGPSCEFCFLILVPLTLWLNIWNNTSPSSATSHIATLPSVYHIDIFVTGNDGTVQNQNAYNLQGLF